MQSVDPSKIKPVPIQKTLLLLNNFIVTTSNFLNGFSETCEKKVSVISAKVTELEILLAVLEAKLNSIPGLEYDGADLPPASASAEAKAPDAPPAATPAPAPAPAPAQASTEVAVIEEPPPAADAAPAGMVAAKDHPDYAQFFKLLKVGVPPPVVQNKIAAAGLDPSYVDNPDVLIPISTSLVVVGDS